MVQTPALDAAAAAAMTLNPNHRVAIVQRCQIRGNGAENGLGSVYSFGVTYRDNVLAGVGLGLNHDTGKERWFTVENNAFIDVAAVANIGGPNCTTDWYQHYAINNNLIRLRGVGYRQCYEDFDYCTTNRGSLSTIQPYTNPQMPVGRMLPWMSFGLLTGGADDLTFNGNRFTTRPQSVFYQPEPGNGDAAQWRPVDALSTDRISSMPRSFGVLDYTGNSLSTTYMGFWPTGGSWAANTISNPTDVRPALSQTFTSSQDAGFASPFVPSGTVGRVMMGFFEEGQNAGRLQEFREVCVSEPAVSGNTVTIRACTFRHPTVLDLSTQTSLEAQGTSPCALQIALFTANGAAFTPSSVNVSDVGNVRTFTVTLPTAANQYYRAVVYRTSAVQPCAFNETRDTWSAVEIHKGNTLRFDQSQDVADDRQLKSGKIRLRRSGTSTASFQFVLRALLRQGSENARCADPLGSTADYELRLADNTLVTCNANGQWILTFPQGANLMEIEVRPRAGSGDVLEYEAAQFVLDFSPSYQGDCAIAPANPLSTSFPYFSAAYGDGAGFAVAIWDGPKYTFARLNETYTCTGGGSSMALDLAQNENAEMPLDGAEESMITQDFPVETEPMTLPPSRAFAGDPLEPPTLLDSVESTAPPSSLESFQAEQVAGQAGELAMSTATSGDITSEATFAYAINDTAANPRVAGYAAMANSTSLCGLPTSFNVGGGWMASSYLEDMQREFVNGILYGVDNVGNHVGRFNSKAWYLSASGGASYELYPITAGGSGIAWWISPDGTKVAGASHKLVSGSYYTRPTLWVQASGGQFGPHDLGSFGGTSSTAAGAALMVNDYGIAVGRAMDGDHYRAFRDMYYNDGTLDTKLDFVPTSTGTVLTANEAYGVNSVGDVVGVSDTAVPRGTWTTYRAEKRATLWWGNSYVPVPLGTVYPIDPNQPVKDPGYSEALAVNHMTTQVGWQTVVTTMVVGSSWTTPNEATYAAAFVVLNVPSTSDSSASRYSIKMINLNDPHLTYFPSPFQRSQWNLRSAEAINNQGVIVGNGTWHATDPFLATAKQWGWMLIPQPEAQP